MNKYDEFIYKMKEDNLNKGAVIDVLNTYVNGSKFLYRLEGFIREDGERTEYSGIIYSDEYEKDEEGYFGENKIMFYSGDGEGDYDIVNYEELYEYLSTACEFYLERNPKDKDIVKELLMRIKEKYDIKIMS